MLGICITTINGWTPAIEKWWETGNHIYIATDLKTPHIPRRPRVTIVTGDEFPRLNAQLKHNHYSRKNLAYAKAMSDGCTRIFETDDDTFPTVGFDFIDVHEAVRLAGDKVNVFYNLYGPPYYPRGFDLRAERTTFKGMLRPVKPDVISYACLGEPDVDAFQRIIHGKIVVNKLRDTQDIAVMPGQHCPFNSQYTLWNQRFEYMLLPTHCSMRACDIVRAERCEGVLTRAWTVRNTVRQERNEHDVMKDFEQELEIYLGLVGSGAYPEALVDAWTDEVLGPLGLPRPTL